MKHDPAFKAAPRWRCTGCGVIGYTITNHKGECEGCGSRKLEQIAGIYPPGAILFDGSVYYGTKSIDLKVHDRNQACMVTVPIVWDGSSFQASLRGGVLINLGPVFEFERAEKMLRKQVNATGID